MHDESNRSATEKLQRTDATVASVARLSVISSVVSFLFAVICLFFVYKGFNAPPSESNPREKKSTTCRIEPAPGNPDDTSRLLKCCLDPTLCIKKKTPNEKRETQISGRDIMIGGNVTFTDCRPLRSEGSDNYCVAIKTNQEKSDSSTNVCAEKTVTEFRSPWWDDYRMWLATILVILFTALGIRTIQTCMNMTKAAVTLALAEDLLSNLYSDEALDEGKAPGTPSIQFKKQANQDYIAQALSLIDDSIDFL